LRGLDACCKFEIDIPPGRPGVVGAQAETAALSPQELETANWPDFDLERSCPLEKPAGNRASALVAIHLEDQPGRKIRKAHHQWNRGEVLNGEGIGGKHVLAGRLDIQRAEIENARLGKALKSKLSVGLGSVCREPHRNFRSPALAIQAFRQQSDRASEDRIF